VKLFRSHDPLFLPAEIRVVGGVFKVVGLKRGTYKTANALRHANRAAFVRADLPAFSAHAFRKTRATWADIFYPTRDAFKAVLLNIGHTSVITTLSVHFPVSTAHQADRIRERSQFVRYVRASANDAAVARL
jgi:integrase